MNFNDDTLTKAQSQKQYRKDLLSLDTFLRLRWDKTDVLKCKHCCGSDRQVVAHVSECISIHEHMWQRSNSLGVVGGLGKGGQSPAWACTHHLLSVITQATLSSRPLLKFLKRGTQNTHLTFQRVYFEVPLPNPATNADAHMHAGRLGAQTLAIINPTPPSTSTTTILTVPLKPTTGGFACCAVSEVPHSLFFVWFGFFFPRSLGRRYLRRCQMKVTPALYYSQSPVKLVFKASLWFFLASLLHGWLLAGRQASCATLWCNRKNLVNCGWHHLVKIWAAVCLGWLLCYEHLLFCSARP